MEEEVKGVSDYVEILRRHKKLVIYPAVFLILVTTLVSILLPATYKSSGLILIESQEIPNELIRSTVTSYADQRIAVIKQKLLTTSKVMEVVKKFNLYNISEKKQMSSVIVEQFRDNMAVEMVEANITDPSSGRAQLANIAFNVSFMNKDPRLAQQVANELTTEFLNENVKTRTARAEETKTFLKEEADKFQRKVQLLEKKIAEFKEEFNASLPELLPYNLSMVENLNKELVEGQNQIVDLKDQVMSMKIDLASLDAMLPSSASQQPATLGQQLAQAKIEYTGLQGKYSENHPDLKRLKRKIESLEAELGAGSNKSSEQAKYKNPLSQRMKSKINSSEREIRRLHERKNEINQKLAVYEKRVAETHQVQRAYDDLSRDYENNLAKYQELRAKELQAELGENLESENKGESFTLIEPPSVPNEPEKPNRPKIFIMGTVASIGFGVGLALLFEMLVGGVRGYNEISRVMGNSPLVVLPIIKTKSENIEKVANRYNKFYWSIGLLVLLVLGFHFFVMDLEIFWFKALRKISLL